MLNVFQFYLHTQLVCKRIYFFQIVIFVSCSWRIWSMRIIYLFALYIILFRHVDLFVRDIYFLLSIQYNQMFAMFNILFAVHYYLFVMFNFLFIENNHLFVLLKYLFPVAEINYLVLKIYFSKISYKHRQVWSYLVIKK